MSLIAGGETDTLEFKSSARYNVHMENADPRLEHVILKTIAGFANADGGTLLIGVNDDGQLLGLDGDLALMQKPDVDRYQLWLTDLLENAIGKPGAATVKVSFSDISGIQLCKVDVPPAANALFVRPPKTQDHEFWVRVGNSTRSMTGNDMLAYTTQQWGVHRTR